MRRVFVTTTAGLAIAILLGGAACAHRSRAIAPPDPGLFAPSDPPRGRFGSTSPSSEHLKPMKPATKEAQETATLETMAQDAKAASEAATLKPMTPAAQTAPDQAAPAPPPAKTPASNADSVFKANDYTYVDELPEAITKVAPEFPEKARASGVAGIVMVAAHVREDGGVDSTRVVRSIPQLDDAARACVQQWRFKPAMSKGNPVAVWVDVPVRFMFPTSPR